MKRIAFNKIFVNSNGDGLIDGKIHTIRQNYEYWKRFEGKEVALFTWEGKSYRSKQKVFCVKRIVSVQPVMKTLGGTFFREATEIKCDILAKNDGLPAEEFKAWFKDYKHSLMAILHFTDFQY